jgi:CRISPR-associated protein Cst1
VVGNDDTQLARRVLTTDDYRSVRALLIRTSVRRVRSGGDPLTTLNDFLKIFEEGDELRRIDWRLAWDLTCIRFVEILGKHDWFREHAATAVEIEESDGDRVPR